MILDESSCMEVAERHANGNPRVAWWVADLLASACRDGIVPTRSVSSVVIDSERHPLRRLVVDPDLERTIGRLTSYVELVEDLLPGRLSELMMAPYSVVVAGAETLYAAVDRMSVGSVNVIRLPFGTGTARLA